MNALKRVLAAAVAPLAVAAGLTLGTSAAHAATFADSRVVALNCEADQITGFTAAPAAQSDVTVPVNETLTAAGPHGTLTWTNATSGGVVTPSPVVGVVNVTATDGAAIGHATVPTVAHAPADGKFDVNALVADDVAFTGFANNNTTGEVDFTTNPATGLSLTLGNAPAGLAMVGHSMQASTAVPGIYAGVKVTATDAAGSAAVETCAIKIFGSKVHPVVPVVSHGHAISMGGSRETVFFTLKNVDACVHFQIFGPGAINGHEGWVPATVGVNQGVYGGLENHHTYLVFFTPVNGPCTAGSRTPVPGSNTGHVTFITGTP